MKYSVMDCIDNTDAFFHCNNQGVHIIRAKLKEAIKEIEDTYTYINIEGKRVQATHVDVFAILRILRDEEKEEANNQ